MKLKERILISYLLLLGLVLEVHSVTAIIIPLWPHRTLVLDCDLEKHIIALV